jgi:hypothetical protein
MIANAGAAPDESVAACATSQVHYKPLVGGDPRFRALPWVQAKPPTAGLVGYLFYYGAPSTWGPKKLARFVIYSGGRSPDDRRNTKILWRAGDRDGHRMVVTGQRIGTTTTFRQVLSVGPAVLRVPSPGCWNLTVSIDGARSHLTVLGVPGLH